MNEFIEKYFGIFGPVVGFYLHFEQVVALINFMLFYDIYVPFLWREFVWWATLFILLNRWFIFGEETISFATGTLGWLTESFSLKFFNRNKCIFKYLISVMIRALISFNEVLFDCLKLGLPAILVHEIVLVNHALLFLNLFLNTPIQPLNRIHWLWIIVHTVRVLFDFALLLPPVRFLESFWCYLKRMLVCLPLNMVCMCCLNSVWVGI